MRADRLCALASGMAAVEVHQGMELEVGIEDFFNLRAPASIDENGIAHIQVKGGLVADSVPAIYEKIGYVTRYGTIINESRAAEQAGAKGIMYHVTSPGGMVMGCSEAASFIASLSTPTLAHATGLACSAAYKLSAGANRITATESAEVGNIGVILTWADASKLYERMGVEQKAMTNEGADYKSTFHIEPNETQLAFLQDELNREGEAFKQHVIAGRSKTGATVDEEVWKAGWYSGARAEQLGLIDSTETTESAYKLFLESL